MRSTTIVLVILLTILLCIRLFFYLSEDKSFVEGQQVNLTHSFLQEPRHNSYGQYFFTSNILVTIPSYPKYYYGDIIDIDGVIKKKDSKRGSWLVVDNPRVELADASNPLLKTSAFVRKRIEKAVLSTLPSKEGGLFLGIILGVRDKIESDFYERLRSVGVLHVIAASGQNVSILASILIVGLSQVVKRKQAILFTAVGIFIYSLLSGFDPPIVRASIMAVITFGAMVMGRQSIGLFALFLTGWSMLILKPELMLDISFQLSFLSTLGIMTVKPIIDRLASFETFSLIKEDITTTLSAQIATFPIMLSSFGSYAILSLPVNVMILWTIPPLMLTGILGIFTAVFSPTLAKPFILIAYPFLAYFSLVVDNLSLFKFSLSFENMPQVLVIGYYLMLIAIVIKLSKRERRKL